MCAFRSILTCIHPFDNRSRGELYILNSTHRTSNERTDKCACYHVLETINFVPFFGSSFMGAAAITAPTCSIQSHKLDCSEQEKVHAEGKMRNVKHVFGFSRQHRSQPCWPHSCYLNSGLCRFSSDILHFCMRTRRIIRCEKFRVLRLLPQFVVIFSHYFFFSFRVYYTQIETHNFSSFARNRKKLICVLDTNEHNCVLYRVVESEANRSAHASIYYWQ